MGIIHVEKLHKLIIYRDSLRERFVEINSLIDDHRPVQLTSADLHRDYYSMISASEITPDIKETLIKSVLVNLDVKITGVEARIKIETSLLKRKLC
jgi:hypothetical protein